MSISIFDILSKAAELANGDPELRKEIAEFDGDKVGFKFTDDLPVTVITDRGKILVESGERPDCQIVIELSAVSLCDVFDKTISPMEISDKSRIVKGGLQDLMEHFFSFIPWFQAITRYYEESSEFKKMIDERKSKK